jgi:hypothetical protein
MEEPTTPSSDPLRSSTPGDDPRPPVLVTGMHRSGTSWLGHILCAGNDFINIGEPLNASNRQTIFPHRVTYWYTYINEANECSYLPYYNDAIMFKLHPVNDIRRMRFGSPRDPFRVADRWGSFLLGRFQERRLLIKDPFAVFSVDWFSDRLGCKTVIVVRRPVAVVASLKSLGFNFDFSNLLHQPALIRGPLATFRSEIEAATAAPDDLIGHGSLLWRIIYETVAPTIASGEALLLRHEDLSVEVLRNCHSLYQALGLRLTRQAQDAILASSRPGNPAEASRRDPFATSLDSRANLANWRRRLSEAEAKRIIQITEPILAPLYPEGLDVLDPV